MRESVEFNSIPGGSWNLFIYRGGVGVVSVSDSNGFPNLSPIDSEDFFFLGRRDCERFFLYSSFSIRKGRSFSKDDCRSIIDEL